MGGRHVALVAGAALLMKALCAPAAAESRIGLDDEGAAADLAAPDGRLPETLYDAALLGAPDRLRAPFDAAARRALWGRPAGPPAACPRPVEPIPLFEPPGFYADRGGWFRQMRPFGYYQAMLADLSDDYVLAQPADDARAACLLDWLDAWASAGALLQGDPKGLQGAYERRWFSGGAAMAWLKVRDHPGLDPARRERVERWLGGLAAKALGTAGELNNHAYWEGFAAAANAVVLNRRDLFELGLARFRLFLGQVQPDGTLPLELKRGENALSYHSFAAEPLVFIAEIAAWNGVELYAEPGLKALVDFVVRGIEDLDSLRRHSEYRQTLCFVCGSGLDWMELVYARSGDARLVPFLKLRRPFLNPRVGGDVTALWGVKTLPD